MIQYLDSVQISNEKTLSILENHPFITFNADGSNSFHADLPHLDNDRWVSSDFILGDDDTRLNFWDFFGEWDEKIICANERFVHYYNSINWIDLSDYSMGIEKSAPFVAWSSNAYDNAIAFSKFPAFDLLNYEWDLAEGSRYLIAPWVNDARPSLWHKSIGLFDKRLFKCLTNELPGVTVIHDEKYVFPKGMNWLAWDYSGIAFFYSLKPSKTKIVWYGSDWLAAPEYDNDTSYSQYRWDEMLIERVPEEMVLVSKQQLMALKATLEKLMEAL